MQWFGKSLFPFYPTEIFWMDSLLLAPCEVAVQAERTFIPVVPLAGHEPGVLRDCTGHHLFGISFYHYYWFSFLF